MRWIVRWAGLPVVAVVTMAGDATPARAQWCALTSDGVTDCGYTTMEQCLETVRGLGGMCNPSPGQPKGENLVQRLRKRRDDLYGVDPSTPQSVPPLQIVPPPPDE